MLKCTDMVSAGKPVIFKHKHLIFNDCSCKFNEFSDAVIVYFQHGNSIEKDFNI